MTVTPFSDKAFRRAGKSSSARWMRTPWQPKLSVYFTKSGFLKCTPDAGSWRFCWCPAAEGNTVADRQACLAEVNEGGGYEAGACNIADLAEFAQGDGAHWRSMSLTKHFGGGAIGATTDVTYDGPAQRDGGAEGGLAFYPDLKWSLRVDWDIDADAEAWYQLLDLAGYDMPGVLWTHTPGPTGEADFATNLRERTSNYFSGWYGLDHGEPDPDPDPDTGVGPAPVPRRSPFQTGRTLNPPMRSASQIAPNAAIARDPGTSSAGRNHSRLADRASGTTRSPTIVS
jgi:hypothetical protein